MAHTRLSGLLKEMGGGGIAKGRRGRREGRREGNVNWRRKRENEVGGTMVKGGV